jgi:hypothetical protein
MITLTEAARDLCMSERYLRDWLQANPVDRLGNPFYLPKGRQKLFEASDIERIKTAMREGERCRLKSIGVVASGATAELLGQLAADVAFAAHSAPKTKTSRRVRLPRSRKDTGTVISMGRGPS